MIKPSQVTTKQIIQFLEPHGEVVKLGRDLYMARGRTHTARTLSENYAAQAAKWLNS